MALNEAAKEHYTKILDDMLTNNKTDKLLENWLKLHEKIDDLYMELQAHEKQISELESELAVKENLLTIKSAITCDLEDGVKLKCECPECGETFNAKLPCGYKLKEDLPFSGEDYLESLVDDLEARHIKDEEEIYNLKITLKTVIDLYSESKQSEEE